MSIKKPIWILLALCFCVVMLTVIVFADNYGGEDDFGVLGGSSEDATTEPVETEQTTEGQDTTEPAGTETTTEPENSTVGDTTEPDASAFETTVPEESVSGEQTTEVVETERGEVTTERPDMQTTEPAEDPSESESQSQQGGDMPLPLILALLGILGTACVAVVVFVLIKYARAQKA